MSRFNNKLLVFNHIISKLVEWKNETKSQTEKEVLKDLSFVPLMKCLYSTCLLSVNMQDKQSLFDLFDNFRAYPKGPVEEDCYYNMNKLPDYQIGTDVSGKDTLVPRQESSLTYSSDSDTEEYFKMADKAILDLKKATKFPEFSDRNNLVELTHMTLWKDAYEDSTGYKLLRTQNNIDNIRKEARSFRNLIF